MKKTLIELVETYQEQGYLHLKSYVSKEIIDQLKHVCCSILDLPLCSSELGGVHESHSKSVNRYFSRTHNPVGLDCVITSLLTQLQLLPLLKNVCGGEIQLDSDFTILSWLPEHIQKGFTGFHQDGPDDFYEEGFPHVWIPIEDDRDVNMRVIPKSHIFGNFPHGMFGQFVKVLPKFSDPFMDVEKDLKVEVGDLLVFSTRLLHCLTLNYSNQTCWSLEFMCKRKEEIK